MDIFNEIRDRKVTVGIAGVLLLVALISIWSQMCATTPKMNHKLYYGIGQVVALETIAAVRDHGQIVAVIDGTFTMAGAAHADEWQEFQRELEKHPGVSLSATKSVEIDLNDTSTGCSSQDFKKLMEEYSDVDAIVFFISLPEWKWLQQHQLTPQRLPPNVIVVDEGMLPSQGHYTEYFASSYVSKLIATRRDAPPALPGAPKTPREWFDKYYQIYTPQNFETLPE